MTAGTKWRTILVIATCINTALMATDITQFHSPTVDFLYRVTSVILNFIIVALATYFNNDYSEEACIGTGTTRMLKAQGKDNSIEWTEELEEGEMDE